MWHNNESGNFFYSIGLLYLIVFAQIFFFVNQIKFTRKFIF